MAQASTEPLSASDLHSLYELARTLLHLEDYDAMLDAVVTHSLEALRAERGFLVLLRGNDRMDFKVVRNWRRDELEGEGEPISRSIVREVLARGDLMLVEDALDDARYGRTESVLRQGIRSVLAAPLDVDRRRVGALYLESQSIRRLFGPAQRDLFERILELSSRALERCLERLVLAERNDALERVITPRGRVARNRGPGGDADGSPPVPAILTQDAGFLRLLDMVEQIAPSDLPVLVQGETGTGKELVVRALHEASGRGAKPLVTVNCGAISPNLLESELFGHKRGAFTGATQDKTGLVAEADGGTLFLDEVGELPGELQVKLLRTLQFGEVLPVGSTRPLRVDVRVLAATNRDLEAEVEDGSFREDLLYRLNVITLDLPPLRDRRDDILPLFYHFLRQAIGRDRELPGVDDDLEHALVAHDWPGNVRELENEAKRLLAVTRPGDPLRVDRLSGRITRGHGAADASDGPRNLIDHERALIEEHLREAAGNRTHAAKSLGISREGLRKKMKRLGLD